MCACTGIYLYVLENVYMCVHLYARLESMFVYIHVCVITRPPAELLSFFLLLVPQGDTDNHKLKLTSKSLIFKFVFLAKQILEAERSKKHSTFSSCPSHPELQTHIHLLRAHYVPGQGEHSTEGSQNFQRPITCLELHPTPSVTFAHFNVSCQ